VAPDGPWSWKDLDDVALLQERGWLSQEDLDHLERAKVEVVGAVEGRCFPFDGSLILRRPDPSLGAASLPVDWDQFPSAQGSGKWQSGPAADRARLAAVRRTATAIVIPRSANTAPCRRLL
jgi:hypothetical protein